MPPARHSSTAPPDGAPAHTNRLIHESSPYLRQHAHNPVDWRAWGPEAFDEARRRGVPIFLSVGYSTCYWCHVMERESFESADIARVMNEAFVCIKVDREERPDVDDIYMQAVQVFTQGQGGWPMSLWLTPPGARGGDDPGLEPFFAGTYFPPVDDPRYRRPGFPVLCRNIAEAWKDQREAVLSQAERTTSLIREQLGAATEPVRIDAAQLAQGVEILLRIYDTEHGGFGSGPTKFPQPVYLDYLMTVAPGIDDPAAANAVDTAVRHTLDRMATGGIHDHLAGGFHRYSVDPQWIVPHFEKMLYDNAQLASTLAMRYDRAADPLDARVLRQTLGYVLREMTDARGGFYSAQDAETDHREGLTYLWSMDELRAALGDEDARFAARVYSVDRGANFRDPHHPNDTPASVLVMPARPDELARREQLTSEAFLARLDAINARLLAHRRARPQPGTDDKVIAAWNGLMIAGMSDGARVLHDEKYLDAAERAARFVIETMRGQSGELMRIWRDGRVSTPAFLEDHAMLAHGLASLARAQRAMGRDDAWALSNAAAIVDRAFAQFAGGEGEPGVLYDTLPGQSDLIVRTRSVYDGAIPAASSVMLHALLDLHELTGRGSHLDRAKSVLASLSRAIRESPVGSINATRALYRVLQLDPAFPDTLGEPPDEPVVLDQAPVEVFAPGERLTVTKDAWAELPIELRIAPGFHINAPEPGVEGMIGLSVRLEGGSGVEMEVVTPPARVYEGGALPTGEGPLMVYDSTVLVKLRLRRNNSEWRGTPIIVITYQACTDDACLAPMQIELDLALDPG